MKLIPQLLRLQMTLDGLQFLAVARALYAGFSLQKKLYTKMRCEYYKIRLFIYFLGRCVLYIQLTVVGSGVSRSSSDAPVPVVLGGDVACDAREPVFAELALLPSESLHCSTSTSTSGSSVSVAGSVVERRSIENDGPDKRK